MRGFSLVLLAAGASSRFGAPKLFQELLGRSVLRRSLDAFIARADVDRIVIVGGSVPADVESVLGSSSRVSRVEGGACRAESVWRGLEALDDSASWVAIHDGARPLVSKALIDRVLETAHREQAAAPALAVAQTIKQAGLRLPSPVIRTVPRHDLFALQTPQAMRRADLLDSLRRCPVPLDQATDDLQLLELQGLPATLVEGESENIKITLPIDLELARLILSRREALSS